MAKDIDDYAWEDICARILGHEVPHGLEISAATLLAANPGKAAPIVYLDAECGPGRPRFSSTSVLHSGGAGDTMRESLYVVDSRPLHRSRRGAP